MNRGMSHPSLFTWRRTKWPVTPEVAGSSPVSPVKVPANQRIVLSVETREST
jgi:hypothetical protein